MDKYIGAFVGLFIYIGAFALGKKIFGDEDIAMFFGAAAGGICFWWLVSKIK